LSISEFKREVHRICSYLARFPKRSRKKKLLEEVNKLPPEQREIAISLITAAIDINADMTSSQRIQLFLAFGFGVVFVAAILVIALAIPNPTDFQYNVFRIILALAAGGVAAVIPGILNVNLSRFITASGALAVFVVVYFYSPAKLVIRPPDSVSISLPSGQTFQRAAQLIVEYDGAVIEFTGFSKAELDVPIKPGRISGANYGALLDHLRNRSDIADAIPKYSVNHEIGKYSLVAAR